jgi:hypothetical protein
MTDCGKIEARHRAPWPSLEERMAQIKKWQAEARLWRRERAQWSDDGGRDQ